MTRKNRFPVLFLLVILLISLSCNLPFGPAPNTATATRQLNATDIAQTVIAQLREGTAAEPAANTRTPETAVEAPTRTPEPPVVVNPPTATFTSSPTPRPCNQALFVTDVTIPDGSEIQTGTSFTKTWRIQNNGSCTWTSGYHVVFVSGDRMNAPDAVSITGGTIPYGGTVDVSVNLTAPADAGTYQGYFRLRSSDGVVFGVGSGVAFYVQIKAVAPAVAEEPEEPAPAVVAEPDLIISDITFVPYPPKKGENVTVKVTSYNKGNAPAGPYTVKWWPGEYYAAPACTWNIGGMVAKGGQVHTCVYGGYPSVYSGINTKASVDTAGAVDESDEGNNTLLKKIDVVN